MESQEGLTRIVSLKDINIEDIVSDIGTLTEQILNVEEDEEYAGAEETIRGESSDGGGSTRAESGTENSVSEEPSGEETSSEIPLV